MKLLLTIVAKGLQFSGMCTLPFAIIFGESQKSMELELKYLVIGSLVFAAGYIIDKNFLKS
jgi:hypothetical protein